MSEHSAKNICYFRAGALWMGILFAELFVLMAAVNVLNESPLRFIVLYGMIVWTFFYLRSKRIPQVCIRLALKKKPKKRARA